MALTFLGARIWRSTIVTPRLVHMGHGKTGLRGLSFKAVLHKKNFGS